MPDRLDRVRLATRWSEIEISWACREQLLDEIRSFDPDSGVIAAFEAVGATRPVILNRDGKATVLQALHGMSRHAGGMHKLSRGCIELHPRGRARRELQREPDRLIRSLMAWHERRHTPDETPQQPKRLPGALALMTLGSLTR